jgi:hypothetical protein
MRFNIIFILFSFLFANYTIGQANYFEHRTLRKDKDFSFPVFSHADDSFAVRSINQLLQLSELYLLDGYQKNNLFEIASADNGGLYAGKDKIGFNILTNTPKILSVMFDESRCGITCTYWVKYYNFNSGNGDRIQLKDLFTPDGFGSFNKIALMKRKNKFKKELNKLETGVRDNFPDVFDCIQDDDLQDFYLMDTSICIDGENCLSKNEKIGDFDMVTKFNLSEFKKHLNDYGKTIFGISHDTISRHRSYGLSQLFEGTMDDSLKILLVMEPYQKNQIIGGYAYLKYGRLISFEGELHNKKLLLVEKMNNGDNGYFDVIFDGNQVMGAWTNKSKTKSFHFIAKRTIPEIPQRILR